MKNSSGRAAKVGIVGAVVSSSLASGILLSISCCAGPIVFLGMGLGWAGLSKFQALAPYRWIFFTLTGIFLAIAFYKLYYPKPVCAASNECSTPGALRYQRIALWISILIIVASLFFPMMYERYLMR